VLFDVPRGRVEFVGIGLGAGRTGYSRSAEGVGLESGVELIVVNVGRVCDLGRGR
jgi:hypothetical protein